MKDISNKCLMCHWYCDEVLEECQGEEEPCHEFVLAREYKIMENKEIELKGGKNENIKRP